MKIDTSQIRGLQVVERPDGRYLKVRYVSRPNLAERIWAGAGRTVRKPWDGTRKTTRKLWKNQVVKTIIIATVIAAIFNIATTIAAMTMM